MIYRCWTERKRVHTFSWNKCIRKQVFSTIKSSKLDQNIHMSCLWNIKHWKIRKRSPCSSTNKYSCFAFKTKKINFFLLLTLMISFTEWSKQKFNSKKCHREHGFVTYFALHVLSSKQYCICFATDRLSNVNYFFIPIRMKKQV